MGLCFSCGKSKDRFKDKGSKICGQIHSVVTPLHVSHEPTSSNQHLNGHVVATAVGRRHSPSKKRNLFVASLQEQHQLPSSLPLPPPSATTHDSMATSFPNMNLTNPIRGLVSKKKNRYKKDGFNLDLTYITPNIIAMGYPASNIEGVYRNHIDEVLKFLDSKHMDHYYIYNLCSERCYDKSKFHNRVQSFPFDDHNPPKMDLIRPFCRDVHNWLMESPKHVAVVHCKAGKGRTGTMICCYLLHSRISSTADEALSYYGQERTQDKKGVTIPSQVRYVRYYERLLKDNLDYQLVSLQIKEIILKPVPNFVGGQGAVCFSVSQQSLTTAHYNDHHHHHHRGSDDDQMQMKPTCEKIYKSDVYEFKKGDLSNLTIKPKLRGPVVVTGDVKIEFYNKSKIGRKERQFQFWFNTFFVVKEIEGNNAANNGFIKQNGSGGGGSSVSSAVAAAAVTTCDQTYSITFKKDELDIVSKKDKQNKVFSADFQLTLVLEKVPTHKPGAVNNFEPNVAINNRSDPGIMQQETPSESSEADSSDDDTNEENWDSVLMDGEIMDPRGVGYRILSECELSSQLTASSTINDQLLTV